MKPAGFSIDTPWWRLLDQQSFVPTDVFKPGDIGTLTDTTLSTLFQDAAGTTPVTDIGQPVGLQKDRSGNGDDFSTATSTARPTYVVVGGISYLQWDLVDDIHTATLPAITGGTVMVFSNFGVWLDDDFNFAGGTFSWGPNTYTGAPSTQLGMLSSLFTDADGKYREIGKIVINRKLTAAEKAGLLAYYGARGCPTEYVSTATTIKNIIPAGTTSMAGRFRYGGWPVIDNSGWDLLDVTNFQGAFSYNQITAIPAGLFDNCPDVTTFQGTFNNNQITTVPAGLFDNCPNVTTFQGTFNNNQITTVPANLFDTQTVCTNYTNTFINTNLTQTSIDNVLVSIAYSATTNSLSNGTFNQSGGSAPSATGEAAIDTLRGLGWTVTVTGGY